MSDWKGGKSRGGISKQNEKFLGRISYNHKYYSKCFDTEQKCKTWLYELSKELNILKNRYRYVDDHLEVELNNGKIMKCDVEHLKYIQKYSLFNIKSRKNNYCIVYYGNGNKVPFHRLIKPWKDSKEWNQVDHINRNGLDNRTKNLRNGDNCVNNNNCRLRKDNTSGKSGIHYSNYDRCWIVQWVEDGKRKKKVI